MADLKTVIKRLLKNAVLFAEHASAIQLRSYQEQVAAAVVDSVINCRGLTFVVIFPRQSGKNELQAQIEAYLLTLYSQLEAEMVKVSPTWKPQSLNAMRRLERVLERNLVTRTIWTKESGYIYRLGSARIAFLSGSPTSNVVGATASLLLQCDEAQDVTSAKWDKEINPMAASTNATRIFWGTAWTSQTLLAHEKRLARELEKLDGIQRVFQIDADVVRQEVPAYGDFVDGEIAKYGRSHPFIRTQYFSEEIDAEGGMFTPERLALMQGDHLPLAAPEPGSIYAFLVDIAGEELENLSFQAGRQPGAAIPASESRMGILSGGRGEVSSPSRDATSLTIVEIDLTSLHDDLIKAPRYLVRHRRLWVAENHTRLYAQLKALAELWQPHRIVVDATGVGAGLSSFLAKAFPSQVMPFIFTNKSKSDLGWSFLSVIVTGRFKDCFCEELYPGERGGSEAAISLQKLFRLQCLHTQMEISPGPERRLRWGVPDGTRNPASGEPVHDDLVISAALCALLDEEPWGSAVSEVIPVSDPLQDLDF